MLPSASNITMPSAVVSRMAARSSAMTWPAAGSTAVGGGSGAGALASSTGASGVNISASADSPSHEMVNSRAAVAGAATSLLAEIVTGVPASDVLLADETPAST